MLADYRARVPEVASTPYGQTLIDGAADAADAVAPTVERAAGADVLADGAGSPRRHRTAPRMRLSSFLSVATARGGVFLISESDQFSRVLWRDIAPNNSTTGGFLTRASNWTCNRHFI